jgi:electron transfer flavoprotein beta subunit
VLIFTRTSSDGEGEEVVNGVVLLKQTPDTETVIRVATDGKYVATDGLKWIINPDDEFALIQRLESRNAGCGK